MIFEGDQGRRYASALGKIVESVQGGLEDIAGEGDVVSLFIVVSEKLE